MATNKEQVQIQTIIQILKAAGLAPNEIAIGLKTYNALNNYLLTDNKCVSCLLSNCRANHSKREYVADKALLRNLTELIENGGSIRPRDKDKVRHTQAQANRVFEDTRQISHLVFFGLATVEELYDESDNPIGTYYTVTQLGLDFYNGVAKIPLRLTVLDGEVYDVATKYLVSRDMVRDEIFKRARLRANTKEKYIPLNDRPLVVNNRKFYSIEEYIQYIKGISSNEPIIVD